MTQPYTAWQRWRSCDRKTGRWDSKLGRAVRVGARRLAAAVPLPVV